MGVADGADIDAQQLELGRHVGPGEFPGRLAQQQRRHIARHAVARSNQAEHAAVPRGAFTDGEDAWVAGAAVIVDHHATARGDLQAAGTAQGVLRADAGREHDQVGFQVFATVEIHPVAVGFTVADRLGGS
jgi:hypothetical protein